MGKPIILQRRGRSKRFEAPSFNYRGRATSPVSSEPVNAKIVDIVHCPGHSAPLAQIEYNNLRSYIIAAEGFRVGDSIIIGSSDNVNLGNVLTLQNIPEGALVHNIETVPGDGGKLIRSAGSSATLLKHLEFNKVSILMPSKKTIVLDGNCRATMATDARSCDGRNRKLNRLRRRWSAHAHTPDP